MATPIGNLGDITLRALATLAAADLIACEDTRVTHVLTARYGIAVPLVPYHEHNAALQRPKLLAALAEGKAVALCSDAGTPLVSDPGYRLVEAVLASGHPVIPVPGPSALLAGLVTAGLPTDTFLFAGFLPTKEAGRRKRLGELVRVPATLVFFESPQRLAASLADMATVLGGGADTVRLEERGEERVHLLFRGLSGNRRADEDDDLTFRCRLLAVRRRQSRQAGAADLLECLGQLARHRGAAVTAEHGRHVG